MKLWLAWNLLGSPGWSQIHWDPPDSVSPVVELKMFATKPVNDTFQNALFTPHSTYVSYENIMMYKSLLLTLMFTTIPMELAKKYTFRFN